MRCCGPSPQTAEQAGKDDILFRLWQLAERMTRFAPLQQHGVEIGVGFEQPHYRVAIPEPQPVELVSRFHVGHSEFEDSAGAVATRGRRHPRARPIAALEGDSQRQ